MKINHYSQFSKKTLLIGLDRQYFILYLIINVILISFFIVFEFNLLILLLVSFIGYFILII